MKASSYAHSELDRCEACRRSGFARTRRPDVRRV